MTRPAGMPSPAAFFCVHILPEPLLGGEAVFHDPVVAGTWNPKRGAAYVDSTDV